jgi:hypothetical protein
VISHCQGLGSTLWTALIKPQIISNQRGVAMLSLSEKRGDPPCGFKALTDQLTPETFGLRYRIGHINP